MKKFLSLKIILLSLIVFIFTGQIAYSADYIYNGVAGEHSFSFNFPSNWFARTMGEKKQGFSPTLTSPDLTFEVLEFEGQSLNQIVNYFVTDEIEFQEFQDELFFTAIEDLIVKKAIYLEISKEKKFAKTFIKRGNVVLVISAPNLTADYYPYDKATNAVVKSIYNSFLFTDNWKTYIDFKNRVSYSFPQKFNFEKEVLSNGLKSSLIDPQSKVGFFNSFVFPQKSNTEALDLIKITNERLDSKYEDTFHGIQNTIKALFVNLSNGKKQSFFIVEQNSNAYVFSGENTETNYPRSSYHNDYVKEILEGVEFFDIEGDYYPYLIFRDIRDNHPNELAINHLANEGVVQGYADKTFGPDNEITRAELTKMIVASINKGDLSIYKNCFPDVKEEWFAEYICFAKENNWVSGYEDGKFKPSDKINRAEALKIIYEGLVPSSIDDFPESIKDLYTTDVSENEWFYKYFVYFKNRDLLDMQHIIQSEGTGYKYLPGGNITRKEVAETISRMKIF